MRKIDPCFFPAIALASLMIVTAAPAVKADSLITTEGEMLVGTVTKTSSGYTIQTSDGPVALSADKVKRVLYDHPPATPAAAPGAAGAAASPAAGSPDAAARKPIDARTLNALLDQGQAALSAAQYGDARDAFKDALAVDPRNALAGRGLGYAYLALAKPTRALDPLELAARTPPVDRTLTLSIASSLVASHNSMRAIKYIKPYLEAHPSPVDEPMLNALGIALSMVDSSAARNPFFADSVKLYMKENAELETTQPGKKRWGVDWLEAGDVKQKQAARQKVQDLVDQASEKLSTINSGLAAAQQNLNTLSRGFGRRNDGKIREVQRSVASLSDEQTHAKSDYDNLIAKLAEVPGPAFPTAIIVDTADLVIGAPSSGVPAIASNTNAPPAGAAKSAADNFGAKRNDKTGDAIASAAPVKPDGTAPKASVSDKPKNSTDQSAAQQTSAQKSPAAKTGTPAAGTDDEPPAAHPAPTAARHVTRYAVAFAIAPDVLVTAADTVEEATSISITGADGKSMTATVLQSHHADGLALLKVEGANFPCLMLAGKMSPGTVTALGFPEVNLFNPVARSMNVSAKEATDSWTVHFDGPPRLPGGPLIQNGAVIGVELGDRDSDPASVPAATLKALLSLASDSAKPRTLAGDARQAVVQVTAER